jgi:hypothetical protein
MELYTNTKEEVCIMADTRKQYYVESNAELQAYDILKRDGVEHPDGTTSPEKICTIYSMDYLDPILEALVGADAKDDVEIIHDPDTTTFDTRSSNKIHEW